MIRSSATNCLTAPSLGRDPLSQHIVFALNGSELTATISKTFNQLNPQHFLGDLAMPRMVEHLTLVCDQSCERHPVLKFKSVSNWKLLHQRTSRSLQTSGILRFARLVLGLDASTVTTIRSAR